MFVGLFFYARPYVKKGIGWGRGKREQKFPEMNNIDGLLLLKSEKNKIMFYSVTNTILKVSTKY